VLRRRQTLQHEDGVSVDCVDRNLLLVVERLNYVLGV
jgi:hypothetical protein